MNISNRIKKVRKSLDMTQQEFADHIGMKRNSIALIEGGRNTSDQTIFAICREFNVNEDWLRTGKGEMFNPEPCSELEALAERYNLTDEACVLIEKFINLKPEYQDAVIQFVLQTAEALKENVSSSTFSDVSAAEAAYEKNLGIAPSIESTVTNTIDDAKNKKSKAV